MKKCFILLLLLCSTSAFAAEGSWFGFGGSYENFGSGGHREGFAGNIEGGYWYLGNVAYGGYFKSSFLESDLKLYDLGAFLKAGTEAGFYGKVQLGMAIVNGNVGGLRVSSGSGLSLGFGGGFLFPASDALHIGPEVIYRHLTAGDGGDQISVGVLVAYGF